jgi:hypothetical protein
MRTIKFSEEEISSLHQIYLEKLSQAEKQIQQIKDVLKKLEVSLPVETLEVEPVVKRRGRKPKVKETEPKMPKKRGRKPKVVIPDKSVPETIVTEPKKRGRKPKAKVVSEIVSSLIDAKSNVELKVHKKRGRKPKAVVVEPKVRKKMGRPRKVIAIPTVESVPETVVKEPKKRGRKPKDKVVEPKIAKKRGRPAKVSVESAPESAPVPINKEEKKVIREKSSFNRKGKGRKRITLKNLSKPLKLKELKESPVDEITSEVEPVAAPTMETIIAQIEEKKE